MSRTMTAETMAGIKKRTELVPAATSSDCPKGPNSALKPQMARIASTPEFVTVVPHFMANVLAEDTTPLSCRPSFSFGVHVAFLRVLYRPPEADCGKHSANEHQIAIAHHQCHQLGG